MADQRLVSILKGTLDADKEVRAAAEAGLAELFLHPSGSRRMSRVSTADG